MPLHFVGFLDVLGYGIVLAGLAYTGIAMWRVWALPRAWPATGPQPPISLFKPVCGVEPHLERNLRSFCEQAYPEFEIFFGVRDPNDPAIPILQRLVEEFPQRATLVVDPTVIGNNYKVANVANMAARARHDIFVVADADCRVGPDYLSDVAAAFADPGVGAVTCVYKGTPRSDRLTDQLGAMFINEWFLPSVLVARLGEPLRYCFGATMAVRRDVLTAIGGFETLAAYLADDFMLGQLVTAKGYTVALATHVVDITVEEPDFRTLCQHELRWARTLRTMRPFGYALSGLTDVIPITILWTLAMGAQGADLALLGAAVGLRMLMHFVVRMRLGVEGRAAPWIVPLRDVMTFGIRLLSFTGRRVAWQNHEFDVQPDGQMVATQAKVSGS